MEKESDPKQNKYFRLMQVVGTSGKYQNLILILFSVLVFEVGSLSLGNPYYFAVAPYANCPEPYTTASQCNSYVCSLPESQRSQYLQPQISQLHTLGNQFGDYHCQNSDIIATAMGMFFLGSIIGYICMGSLVDNFGRRLTFNLCLFIGVIGQFCVIVSPNLVLAQIGLFLIGFGLENAFNLCFYFLSQQFENNKRQIGGVIIQCSFCVGGLSTIFWFYAIKNWKIIFWLCYFIPLCTITILSFFILKQTPQFLIKRYQIQDIRKQLKFIAKLNKREQQFETSEYTSVQSLQSLKNEYEKLASSMPFFTFRDLFRFKSLRMMSILLGLVSFSVDFLYYAPLMLIDQFGFNFYANGVIINISQFITYGVTFFYIIKLQRNKLALYLFSISFVCSFALVFLHTNVICQGNCWGARMVFQLIIVFILRFAVALQFQILLIYVNELYPTQIAGIGLSYVSLMGTLPNLFIPELINICNRYGINIMIFFCIISIVGLIPSRFLKETKGLALTEQIQQIGLIDKKGVYTDNRNKQIELVEEMS